MTTVNSKQLFSTGRPMTGVFALVLTIIGFLFLKTVPWDVMFITALSFTGIVWSIMAFNDWVDREHDFIGKGKRFAYDHPKPLLKYIGGLSLGILILLGYIMANSPPLAIYCFSVWGIGLGYSFTPKWYLVQNLIVGACSASPVLCGMIYANAVHPLSVILFLTFTMIIVMREVYKDMEDQGIDTGYKNTLPVKQGQGFAAIMTYPINMLVIVGLLLYPAIWVNATAILFVPLHTNVRFLWNPRYATSHKAILDLIIGVIFVAILVTQLIPPRFIIQLSDLR